MDIKERIKDLKVPGHLAIICDGNGRWAKQRGQLRMQGHVAGVKAAENIIKLCHQAGIKHLSLFLFSTENWDRPKPEIDGLMKLMFDGLAKDPKEYVGKGVRFKWLGEEDGALPDGMVEKIRHVEKVTENEKDMVFTACVNYGGRQEIVNAVKKAAADGAAENMTVEGFRKYLYGGGLLPDIDLVIRTSGEQRVSNFMMWYLAYAEFYFPKYHWPDFNEDTLVDAIKEFTSRDRRFGAIKE
ncbi:MAG: polyprenyl diphosphate synthase [Alphaproteobacteria bacterium]|nr:polyprenyl diphosphate synthase [Alphaproteobacteria bacterium]